MGSDSGIVLPDKTGRPEGAFTASGPLIVMLAFGMWGQPVSADPPRIGGSLAGGGAYIDNLFLAPPSETAEEEVVLIVAPELWVTAENERLTADVHYRMEALGYPDFSDSNQLAHELAAQSSATVLMDKFYFDLSAAAGQQLLDPLQPIALSNIPISGNRADYLTVGGSPRWQQRFGDTELLMRSEYTRYFFDSDQAQAESRVDSLFQLGNIFRDHGATWTVRYSHERYAYKSDLPYEYQRADVTLGYWVTSSVKVFASGGKETPIDQFLDPSMEDDIWEGGFRYEPSDQFSVEAAAGQRGYGDSYRGDLSYLSTRGEISVTYVEGPQSRAGVFGLVPSFEGGDLSGILDPLGSSDRFLQKRAALFLRKELAKTNVELQIFSDKREEVTTADGEPRPDEKYEGASLRAKWQAGAKTELAVFFELLRTDDFVESGEVRHARMQVTYRLGSRSALELAFDYISDEVDVDGPSYDVSQVSLMLRRNFGAAREDL